MTSTVAQVVPRAAAAPAFDAQVARGDFPAFARAAQRGRPLVYLDNASTTQKPRQVLEAGEAYYTDACANVHRGVYALAARANAQYERARERVRALLGARSAKEIVFVRGTTEAINLVASALGRAELRPGDEILVSQLEHHSNIVPWQLAAGAVGAQLKVVPITPAGELRLDELERLVGPRTRVVAVAHVSNVLGTINDIGRIARLAHRRGALLLVDGAQAVGRLPIDVRALDCDFYAFSGHKMYGPTGIGALYGREELLARLPPVQGGGDMIRSVSFERTTYAELPHKHEAGTPNVAGAIGLGAAVDYVERLGVAAIGAHEDQLAAAARAALAQIPGLQIQGHAVRRAAVVSFTVEGIHAHDLATIADREGVAVRAGHHCAQPLMQVLGVSATTRASFGLYNTASDVDALVRAIWRAKELLQR